MGGGLEMTVNVIVRWMRAAIIGQINEESRERKRRVRIKV
jgi:hypothetical protein